MISYPNKEQIEARTKVLHEEIRVLNEEARSISKAIEMRDKELVVLSHIGELKK